LEISLFTGLSKTAIPDTAFNIALSSAGGGEFFF